MSQKSLHIRQMNTQDHIASLDADHIVDSRKKQVKKFGATFFLRAKAAPKTEQESWNYLQRKLGRRAAK